MSLNRDQLLDEARSNEIWDIIVIGGGATGLGTAVDAASRGYRTLLLESHDFGKGTSGRSTKLIHGGVRYLRQGNIKMVNKALRERGRLLKNAPDLVKPLRFVIPCYKWWHKTWYGAGMRVYDALARKLSIAPSRTLSREETIAFLPGINPDNLRGGVEYWDAQFDDTRLLVSLALTCASLGGVLLNYMRVTEFVNERGRIQGVVAVDEETGTSHCFRSRVVVNATGIFTDGLRRMDDPASKPMMQAAQGIHLVLDSSFLSSDTALMVPDTDDGRVIFGVPWNGRILLGTTDTPRNRIDVEPLAGEDEIRYLLDHASRYLAKAPRREDVLSIYAGLRPLVKTHRSKTKSMSRDHTLRVSKSGLVTITGGKWTTYRQMGEDAVNRAAKVAGLPKKSCITRELRLETQPQDDTGSMESSAQMDEKLHGRSSYTRADVLRAVRHEMARTVEDVLARRTRMLFLDARAAIVAAPKVASIMAAELGWNEDREIREVARFNEIAQQYIPSYPFS